MTNVVAAIYMVVVTNSTIVGYEFPLGSTNQVWETRIMTNSFIEFPNPYIAGESIGIRFRQEPGPLLLRYTQPGPIINPCP